MGYYDAEIHIQDVNPRNAKIFKEGWMYVTALKDKEAPLYFAPYFTREGTNSGISMICRVVGVRVVKLADAQDIFEPATEEQRKRWRKGLCMLRKRAEKEGFSDQLVRLFFLDKPIEFRSAPLSKKAFNTTNPPKKMPPMLPKGFSLRFDELLTASWQIGDPHN